MKQAPHRPPKDEKVAKFATFSGHAATAKTIAAQIGVGERTVRNAAKFTEAVEALVSLKAGSIARQITERLPSQRFTDAPLEWVTPPLLHIF